MKVLLKSFYINSHTVVLGALRSEDGDGREKLAEKVNSHSLLQVTNFVK